MKDYQYSIQDIKSGEFESPFRALNDADAVRGIIMGIRTGKPMFARFPADYALYSVGYFETESGQMVSNANPRFIANIGVLAANDKADQTTTMQKEGSNA